MPERNIFVIPIAMKTTIAASRQSGRCVSVSCGNRVPVSIRCSGSGGWIKSNFIQLYPAITAWLSALSTYIHLKYFSANYSPSPESCSVPSKQSFHQIPRSSAKFHEIPPSFRRKLLPINPPIFLQGVEFFPKKYFLSTLRPINRSPVKD